ncbi:uncharacterized protein LOC131653784 [Vicia villosa]|uniref:uncharacterized protein LOC131653784 n=1 Tax=Vicia villosa TaxID=3911 RepID=UPI00273C216C|nr:uncharacterized protein LOC131653784 [Vicia villosa]
MVVLVLQFEVCSHGFEEIQVSISLILVSSKGVPKMRQHKNRNVGYKFAKISLGALPTLAERSSSANKGVFEKKYRKILDILDSPLTEYQEGGVHTLLHFYEPSLRCFTFVDFQLLPTLEEYSYLVGVPVERQVPFYNTMEVPSAEGLASALYLSQSWVKANFESKVNRSGFSLKCLLKKAHDAADKEVWREFNAVLALCVYGIVLFPNIPEFVDINAIRIFTTGNPVPTLLGDVYHSVHSRNHKGRGGIVNCCLPLLYMWFNSHMPCKGAFVATRDSLTWAKRLMGLRAKDIRWYTPKLDWKDDEMVSECGDFDNVPLIGVRGGINYNPRLAVRQLGFALVSPPKDRFVKESLVRIKADLGKRDCIAHPDYTEWVEKRAKDNGLPFPFEDPLYTHGPDFPVDMSVGKFLKTADANEQLREENLDLSMKLFDVNQEKKDLSRKLRMIGEGSGRKAKAQKRQHGGITVADEVTELKKALEEAEARYLEKQQELDEMAVSKEELQIQHEAEIASLTSLLQRSDDRIDEGYAQRKRLQCHLQGSQARLDKVLKENQTLRDQLQEKDEIIRGLTQKPNQ